LGLRIASAAAAAVLLLVGPASAAGSGISWKAGTSPFRLTFLVGGTARAVEAAPPGSAGGGRLGYRLADGSFHGLRSVLSTKRTATGTQYRVATDEPSRTALITVRATSSGAAVTFSLQPATGVVETTEAFAAEHGEHFLGGGERQNSLDLVGQSLPIKASKACDTTLPAPFFVSSRGYGVALRSTAIASMAFPGSNLSDLCYGAGPEPPCKLVRKLDEAQLCAKSASLSYGLFAGTPEQVVSAYVRSIGTPRVPPLAELELIKWRDAVSGPAQLYQDIDEFHSLGIPIGWELLDNPWEPSGCLGSMTFDPAFGDPAAMIKTIHADNVRFMLWISPLVQIQGCGPLSRYPAGTLLGSNDGSSTIDLTAPAARAAFETSLRKLVALGVDGFKADRGDEIDLEPLHLAGGSGRLLHNEYPLLFARAVAAAAPSSSFVSLFRAGAPGSASVAPGFWGGDQPGSFRGLREAIHDGLSAGLAGYAVWGSDTGGYLPTETPETFVRWAQFSAICPIFEVGGQGQNATPWEYGPVKIDLFRDAVLLHYELVPYLYALARAAHTDGTPVLRPLALEYPNDPASWSQDYEVLVGHDLLAAPVVQPAPTPVSIHVPSGTWVDLTSGGRITGPVSLARVVPLTELPLYLRAGAVIPFAARAPAIWSKPWPVEALQMPGRGGWLYAPAAGTADSRTSDFGRFHATVKGRVADIALSGAPPETQLELVGVRPASIRIDGQRVPASTSDAELAGRSVGWEVTQMPFAGIVLKLAPTKGATTVDVTLR
jgi:alpha-D-xyloside xylohydrolase